MVACARRRVEELFPEFSVNGWQHAKGNASSNALARNLGSLLISNQLAAQAAHFFEPYTRAFEEYLEALHLPHVALS
ncbi:hypothetical protein EON66_03140 [archaeon]|nr:MAG: hypothetical protein EON66_03140 [archaeon]